MRPRLASAFQDASRGSSESPAARRLSDLLVVGEVALALMLLVVAGLLLRSFVLLTSIDPGYRTDGVVAARVALPASRYAPAAAKKQFFDALVERVSTLPDVTRVSAVSALPMSPLGVQFDLPFTIDGLEVASPSERPRAAYRAVMTGDFETMRMRLVEGRTFTRFDGRDDGPKVAIVNALVARRYFPDRSPINHLVPIPMAGDLTIVGVVADVRHDGLGAAPVPEVFVPYNQFALSEMQLVIETARPAATVARAVRAELAQVDGQVPIAAVTSLEDAVSASIAQPWFNMILLTGLALCAALLAAIGVYGVVTHPVARRTTEIGIRMALGADARATFLMVVRRALRVVATGVIAGVGGAMVFGTSVERLLYGVPALDPATFGVAAALLIVGLGAAVAPALRATRIDAVNALRDE
jgi:putative ABC transport system permease protein